MSFTLPTPSLEIQHANFRRFQQTDDGAEWLLEFPAPGKLWSSNNRTAPMAAANYRKTWRAAAARWGNGISPGDGRWLIMCGLPFRRASARRDPHNWTGTVVKAIIDGLGPPGRISPGAGWWVDDDETRIRVLDSYTYVAKPPCPMTVAVHGFRIMS